ncbi:MAG TPA: chalcone isomerase family protein [Myxococcales bacterium]
MTALLLAIALAAPAVRDVYGVQVPESVFAGGRMLFLNGTGLRKKVFFKVYVASLYLEKVPDQDPASVVGSDQIKRVDMGMLRDLDRGKIVDAVREGFEKNSRAQMPQLQERLDRFVEQIPDLKEGQRLTIAYFPGQGTTVVVGDGEARTRIEGKDFADALFRVWLGDDPVDSDLKDRMLGR